MIAIICAMNEEKDAFKKLLNDYEIIEGDKILYHNEILNNEYYLGKIENNDIVLTRCGVGQIYASICTNLLINKFNPELIINSGIGGSLSSDIHVGDVVVADRVSQWRVDVPGWDRNNNSKFMSVKCDERIIDISKNINDLKVGNIVSADEFIYKKNQLNIIKKYFPEAKVGEMEGASIGLTAYAFNKKVSIIRSISDETYEDNNFEKAELNLIEQCEKVSKICYEIIKRY